MGVGARRQGWLREEGLEAELVARKERVVDVMGLKWSGSVAAQAKADEAYRRIKAKRGNRRKQSSSGRQISYGDYLRKKHWRRKRRQALSHHGAKCSVCGAVKCLEVHHRTYVRLWKEKMSDLQVLCADCHRNTHEGSVAGCVDSVTEAYLSLVSRF